MARPPKLVSVKGNIRVDQVAGLFESQLEKLISSLTDELLVKLRTESPPGDGTPVVTGTLISSCLLYTSPSPRDVEESRMPSSA